MVDVAIWIKQLFLFCIMNVYFWVNYVWYFLKDEIYHLKTQNNNINLNRLRKHYFLKNHVNTTVYFMYEKWCRCDVEWYTSFFLSVLSIHPSHISSSMSLFFLQGKTIYLKCHLKNRVHRNVFNLTKGTILTQISS